MGHFTHFATDDTGSEAAENDKPSPPSLQTPSSAMPLTHAAHTHPCVFLLRFRFLGFYLIDKICRCAGFHGDVSGGPEPDLTE